MIDIESIVKTTTELALGVAQREKEIRKKKRMTQANLAKRASVSLASLRRFEQTGLIAFDSLIRIAIVLGFEEDISQLFSRNVYTSIQEVIDEHKKK